MAFPVNLTTIDKSQLPLLGTLWTGHLHSLLDDIPDLTPISITVGGQSHISRHQGCEETPGW
jgi:hypothetical protein